MAQRSDVLWFVSRSKSISVRAAAARLRGLGSVEARGLESASYHAAPVICAT